MNKKNIILSTDSYKLSHWKQYPPGTQKISSYIEARGNGSDFTFPEIVHAGVQPFIMDYLSERVTFEDINEAEEYIIAHGFEFNRAGWIQIVRKLDGRLPIHIESLPEGTVIPIGTPQVQIINTDNEFPWLTSYLETTLHRSVWYMSTVATISRECKKIIWSALQKTCDNPAEQIMFKLHDFGARGASSGESAMLGGMAHLFNFMGTDTIEAIVGARKYYDESMAGFSIPAAEHSTITSWAIDGDKSKEVDAFRNMVTKFAGDGKLYAVVSDSYDIYRAVRDYWGGELKGLIQKSGGTLIIRPDSGDPINVIRIIFHIMEEKFGFTLNQKGYKVLPPYVRLIQGDGVNPRSIKAILRMLEEKGWSAENIAFGMGGALLQKLDRDTFKYAMKANAIQINDQWHDVYKDPITDSGKKSKRGVLAVTEEFETIPFRESDYGNLSILQKVYNNGMLFNKTTLKEIRERCAV